MTYLDKTKYTVREIALKEALEPILKYHYLHRKPSVSKSFGLYDENTTLVGVIMYGSPPSKNLKEGICGADEATNVFELQRLWIAEGQPTNAASFLIGRTLKLAGKEIIVSYADTAQSHVGKVYQATNFLYTGLSAKRTDRKIEGRVGHSYDLGFLSAAELRETYGDKYSLVERSRKHRYVIFNAKGKRKVELLEKLKYTILPYPQ